ncbi:ribosomal protein S10 domain-containing protein, partial [Endogone sp. FLAS-F59071]
IKEAQLSSRRTIEKTVSAQLADLPKPPEKSDELDELYTGMPSYPHTPPRHPATHHIPVCNLHFRSYQVSQLDLYVDFAQRAAYSFGLSCGGPAYLPTQRSMWTLLRSPFIHKKSQENFERRTHKRVLQVRDGGSEAVRRWLGYLKMNAPGGVGMRATIFEYEEIGVGKRMMEEAKKKQRGRGTRVEGEEIKEEEVKGMAEELVKKLEKEDGELDILTKEPVKTLEKGDGGTDILTEGKGSSNVQ